jgi:hypothetical protein
MSAAPVVRAYCYPSGLIEFGRSLPKGATIIARGPKDSLRAFIGGRAHRRQQSRKNRGRPINTESLFVPGVAQAQSLLEVEAALKQWTGWIASQAPKGVRVLVR